MCLDEKTVRKYIVLVYQCCCNINTLNVNAPEPINHDRRQNSFFIMQPRLRYTYSDSSSATVHLYCAVENRQISANCLTATLIFLTVLFELLAMCTFTDIVSP